MNQLAEDVRRALSSRMPPVSHRVVFSTLVSLLAAAFTREQYDFGRPHSDFGMVWFGARALIAHLDPYSAIGVGKAFNYDWPLIYPGTALVAVMPFVLLTEQWATTMFVGMSTWLLAFGITRDGWYRIPIFITGAFISSAQLGQWSILFTAALFLPFLAFFSIAKPQAALPVLAGSTTKRALWIAAIGACVLLVASLAMDPHWFTSWLEAVRRARNMEPAIVRMGGPLLLIVLLRWRRPETWLLLTLAALPQSWGWYSTLPLFTVPKSFREAVFLLATALCGAWYADNVLNPATIDQLVSSVGSVIVFTIYLPAALLILRRKNDGPVPAWLASIQLLARRKSVRADVR
jgi:hypothetical protein